MGHPFVQQLSLHRPGRERQAFMAEECVINFSLTISVALEGWSLLFSFAAAARLDGSEVGGQNRKWFGLRAGAAPKWEVFLRFPSQQA